MSTGEQKPSMQDASAYLNKVKDTFQHEKEKYEDLIDLLNDFKAKRIAVLSVRERVMELLKGHRDLLVGFNFFLPKAYEIILEDEEPPQIETETINGTDGPNRADGLAFARKVRLAFLRQDGKFSQFMATMKDFSEKRLDLETVKERVKKLFKGHDDLIVAFNYFLPKGYEITLPLEAEQPPSPPKDEPVEPEGAEDLNLMGRIKVAECLQGHVEFFRNFTNLFIGSKEEEDDEDEEERMKKIKRRKTQL